MNGPDSEPGRQLLIDFYSQNQCLCSSRSHGPLLCAFCLCFHIKQKRCHDASLSHSRCRCCPSIQTPFCLSLPHLCPAFSIRSLGALAPHISITTHSISWSIQSTKHTYVHVSLVFPGLLRHPPQVDYVIPCSSPSSETCLLDW